MVDRPDLALVAARLTHRRMLALSDGAGAAGLLVAARTESVSAAELRSAVGLTSWTRLLGVAGAAAVAI
ncbi:MAG: hypothetical protein JO023_06195 [Chloroflexi bacterium]|nr:hypothetical protein [Chloroflexota bacterium]